MISGPGWIYHLRMAIKSSPDDLLTPSDAARLVGISADMMRVHGDRGNLPSLRTVSGRRLFRRADVERFVASRSRAA